MWKVISSEFVVPKGLRQGCGMSPSLFKIYLETVLSQWNRSCSSMGIEIKNKIIHSLLFADDQVIMAQERDDIKFMTKKLISCYKSGGLNINFTKTEYLVVGGESRNLNLENGVIRAVDHFKYLGSVLHQSGTCERDVENRVSQARSAIKQLNGVLWSRNITHKTKLMILNVIVESILTYGAEGWTLNERQKNTIKAVEMDGLRRSLRVSRLQKVRNDIIMEELNLQENIIDRMERRQLQWFGHVQRMSDERWPKKVLNWSPPGRRKRGRPRYMWRGRIIEAMRARGLEDGSWNNREEWKKGIQGNRL